MTALLALFIAFCQYNPLYGFLYFLPVYNKLRIPARVLLLLDFALAILASHGLQLLFRLRGNAPAAYRRHVRLSLAGTLLLCVSALAFVLNLKRVFAFYRAKGLIARNADVLNSVRLDNPGLYVPLLVCVLSLAALTFFYLSKTHAVSIATLFSVLILDLFFFVHFSDSEAGYTKYWFNAPLQPETLSFLKREEPDFNRFRVLSAVESPYANVSETVGTFEPNMNTFFKVPIVVGHDPLPLGWYRNHVLNLPIRTLIRDNRVLSLLNVKYLVASPPIAAFIESNRGPGFPDYQRLFRSADDLVIYRNPHQLARAFWVERVRSVTDAETAWKIVLDPLFDVRHEAVVIGSGELPRDDADRRRTMANVNVIEDSNQYMRLSVDADSHGFLVIDQSHYPGWHGYIDGVAATGYSADAILSGIFLERGRHTVEWRFEPASFRLGLTLTFITGLGCLVFLIIKR